MCIAGRTAVPTKKNYFILQKLNLTVLYSYPKLQSQEQHTEWLKISHRHPNTWEYLRVIALCSVNLYFTK